MYSAAAIAESTIAYMRREGGGLALDAIRTTEM
jgi:hypothetical protein